MAKARWIAAGLALWGAIGSVSSAAADPAAPLYDPSSVASIEFTLTAEDRAALDADPTEYVPARLQISAAAGSYDEIVGLRLKGTASFRTLDGKAAFKVDLREFDGPKFLGLKKLTLNNMVQDASMLHEVLTYDLFRAAGVPAPRTGYAYVRINGADYGVYLNVETVDDVWLPLWFASTQHLYEGELNTDVIAADIDRFEVDEGDEDDRSDLAALIDAVAAPSPGFAERMAPVADLPEMAREFAVEKYAGAFDAYTGNETYTPNNYYLHSDDAGVFSMIPWGHDTSLMAGIPFDGPGGVLYEGCRSDAACWASFRDTLATLPATVTGLGLEAKAQQLAAMLEPWQQADPRREQTMATIAEEVEDTREFLRLRPGDLYDQAYWIAGSPIPRPPDPPADPPTDDPRLDDADREHPETTITRAPRDPVNTAKRRVTARFRFESTEPGSTFQCRHFDDAWYPCSSPERFPVGPGNQSFRVRATDAAGNTDPWAARHRWTVRAR